MLDQLLIKFIIILEVDNKLAVDFKTSSAFKNTILNQLGRECETY